MKKIFFVLSTLLFSMIAVALSYAESKDYYFFEWGDSETKVDTVLRMFQQTLVERGNNTLSYLEITDEGTQILSTYFFDAGLEAVMVERRTGWFEGLNDEIPLEYYMPQLMREILFSSNDTLRAVVSTDSFRFWQGERSIAGSFYAIDNDGRYSVFSFVGLQESTRLLEIGLFVTALEQPFPWELVLELMEGDSE